MRLTPVVVTASPPSAATALVELLEDYGATLSDVDGTATIEIEPIDDVRRGTVIYRVVQASRTVADRIADAEIYLHTEDGNRWRLPPPAL